MSDNKIIKQFEGFISDTYPNFFYSDHPQFQLFLDAYFEWLEKDNTEESKNAKDIFKSVPNAAAIINHAPEYRDVDLSLRHFLNYFKREVMPFFVEQQAVPDPFFIKKMREVYLAKGTLKSFELLFKMLYDEDIEAYETRDFILESSEGNYQSVIICYFKVKERISDFDKIDFNLSGVYDSENSDKLLVTILDITPIGTVDSDNKILFLAQLAVNTPLKIGSVLTIKEPGSTDRYIKAEVVPSLSKVVVSNSAGMSETDVIIIKSKESGRSTTATISTESGPITHLFFRNRGYDYKVGDEFVFTVNDLSEGDGASAKITEVDSHGRIVTIDGVQVRTGENNNGILTNNFEDALIPIQTQGRYKEFPTVTIQSKNTIALMQPYGGSQTSGYGAQFTPWSESVGAIKSISTLAAGAFKDSDDVEILAPAFVRLYNPDGTIGTGNTVVVQQFMPDSDAFLRDSDTLTITFNLSNVTPGKTYILPYGFDSETWQWKSKEYTIDSEGGFRTIESSWDSDNGLLQHNDLYKVSVDSETFVMEAKGPLIWELDDYHFEQLNGFKNTVDSEFTISYTVEHGEPTNNLPETFTTGYWRTTNYQGKVYRKKNTDQYFILPVGEKPEATTEIIEQLSKPRNTILRLCAISPTTGEPIFENNLALGNIIAQWSKPVFDFRLNGVWETDKRFIDDAGFLNSPSGGVLQDSYIYSYYTYLIQSMLPVGKWRSIVKETLHPAGMIMVSELKYSPEADVTPELNVTTEYGFYKQSRLFDAAGDYHGTYRAPASDVSQIYSDSLDYAVDAPNAYDQINIDGRIVVADHKASVEATIFNTHNGNAWWDFEPLGLQKTEDLNPLASQTIENWDDDVELKRRVTTQNQNGDSEWVTREYVFYKQFDGSRQDSYKTSSRSRIDKEQIGLVRTIVTQEYYHTYDSDFQLYFYARWSDSDSEVYSGIDYNRLKRDPADPRNFQGTKVKRMLDLQLEYEADLQKAMREDKSLSFTQDSDETTYYDFDAFEFKWNTYNSERVQNENGGSQWQVPGYTSWLQNRGLRDYYGNPRAGSWITEPKMSTIKTPYRNTKWWIYGDSDVLFWTDAYVPPINTKTVNLIEWDDPVEHNFTDPLNPNFTYRDPRNSMRGRRKE